MLLKVFGSSSFCKIKIVLKATCTARRSYSSVEITVGIPKLS